MAEPENAGEIRNDKGQFLSGVSGNPAGKPPGTVSIVAKIKRKFEEYPEYFEEWVAKLMEDPKERRAIMEPDTHFDITSIVQTPGYSSKDYWAINCVLGT